MRIPLIISAAFATLPASFVPAPVARVSAAPASQPAALTEAEFRHLHALIKPQPGESKWATVPWLTNLGDARQKSAAQDKPIFVWRAGGGEVLGRA